MTAQVTIALGVDDDRAHAVLDGTHRDPAHRDRLTRPRRTDHQRVRTTAGAAERDPDRTAVPLLADQQLAAVEPRCSLAGQAPQGAPRMQGTHDVQRSEEATRDLRQIAARLNVFAPPTTTAARGAEGSDAERQAQ